MCGSGLGGLRAAPPGCSCGWAAGLSPEGAPEQSPASDGAPTALLSPVTANKATIPQRLPSRKCEFFPIKGYWENETSASVQTEIF